MLTLAASGTSSRPGFADNTQKAGRWGNMLCFISTLDAPEQQPYVDGHQQNLRQGVAAMLYPITKPSRVPKVGSGRTFVRHSTADAQSTSRPQPADTSSTPDQIHAAFQYALAAFSSVAMSSTAQSSPEVQSGGVQQASEYAQVEQQAGQTLDITA